MNARHTHRPGIATFLVLWAVLIGAAVLVSSASPAWRSGLRRRVLLAHELCHVLFDRPALEPLQRFDRFDRRRGEDKPAVSGHDEAAWSKNRRGVFVACTPK